VGNAGGFQYEEELIDLGWVWGVEYFLDGQGSMDLDYIRALEREMVDSGVTVPLSFNDVSINPHDLPT
jgi:hypothetical protein